MFLLFQGRILIVFISHVFVTPSSLSNVIIPNCVLVAPNLHLNVILLGRILVFEFAFLLFEVQNSS
jgi:hypothetical protein